jgi:bacillolysin
VRSRRLVGGLAAFATVIGGSAFVAFASPANAGSTSSIAFGSKSPTSVATEKGSDGRVHVLEAKGGTIPRPSGVSADDKPEKAATAHLSRYAEAFGVKSKDLKLNKASKIAGGSTVRYDQVVDGVEVLGGQLVASLDTQNNLQAIVGETTAATSKAFPTADKILQGRFRDLARKAVAFKEKLTNTRELKVEADGPKWFDPEVLGAPKSFGTDTRGVYTFTVSNPADGSRYGVLINAKTKKVELVYDLDPHGQKRLICDAAKAQIDTSDPKNFACGPTLPVKRAEGGKPAGVADVDQLYTYMGDTSVRYASYVNIDLTALIGYDYGDGKGKALRGTVRLCTTDDCPYPNAFWNGLQITHGEGTATDDIVGHELSHGVTEHTSELAYLWQSGAINEAMSDIFGELVDLGNKSADDTAANRWKIGEGSSLGVIRDMKNPTAQGQPDKLTSSLWEDDPQFLDNGGVHTNSGPLNKAASLLTDGGKFNGYDVKGIGPAKTFKTAWTLENLLTPGADYKDVMHYWPLACRKNIDRAKSYITESDCQQVDKVVRATEMYKDPAKGAPKTVDYCAPGKAPKGSYVAGFENKTGWTFQTADHGADGDSGWFLSGEVPSARYAAVGEESAVAWTLENDDLYLTQNAGVTVPANAWLRFDHADLIAPEDGAELEYSTNGVLWNNASALPNTHGESVEKASLLGGKSFDGISNGFSGTRYDLSSLSGQTVRFRFHVNTPTRDSVWFVDNLKLYTCN